MTSSVGPNSANLLSSPLQGIRRGVAEFNTAAQKIAEGEVTPDNFAGLLQAEIMIKANRVTAETASDLIGTLLDRKA